MSLHHNVDAYLKSALKDCYQAFSKDLANTRQNRFRSAEDIQRVFYSFFHLARDKGRLKIVNRTLWQKICACFHRARLDSLVINQKLNNAKKIERLRKFNPALFCLNDASGISSADRLSGKRFLEELFPEPSSFEKSE